MEDLTAAWIEGGRTRPKRVKQSATNSELPATKRVNEQPTDIRNRVLTGFDQFFTAEGNNRGKTKGSRT